MTKQKLNFRFHNPNTAEAAAGYILKIFIEANREEGGRALQDAADLSLGTPLEPEREESHSA